jgi:hypothetical protein
MTRVVLGVLLVCSIVLAYWSFTTTYTPTAPPDPHAEIIVVSTPAAHSTVSHQISVSGRARGTWFFEGSSPLHVEQEGVTIATGHATATSSWMTTDFVPFTASVTIPQNIHGNVTLVLSRDNPSGLPAYDDSISIPLTVE